MDPQGWSYLLVDQYKLRNPQGWSYLLVAPESFNRVVSTLFQMKMNAVHPAHVHIIAIILLEVIRARVILDTR
jgi:hypothetical protein